MTTISSRPAFALIYKKKVAASALNSEKSCTFATVITF